MRTLLIRAEDVLPFDQKLKLAEAVAGVLLVDPMLLSWYDGERGMESPNGVSECSQAAPTAGVWSYAAARGGALAVTISGLADSLFCFRDNGQPGMPLGDIMPERVSPFGAIS